MKKHILSLVVATMATAGIHAQTSTTAPAQMQQLFMPFTYYPNAIHNLFTLDSTPTQVSQTLVDFYLKRPDLVQTTEEALLSDYTTPTVETVKQQPVLPSVTEVATPIEPEAPQVDVELKKPNFWKFKGDGYLQFLQNYVSSNWYKGGESNYSMLSSLTLEANYDNKSKWKWDNKLELKLGFQTSRSDSVNKFKTNEDLIRLTSKVGLQATKRWYYTLQMIATTQFTRGLKANDKRTYSDFMSPLKLNLGLGMEYKIEWLNKHLTGTANFSALAANYQYVDRSIFRNSDTDIQWFPSRHGIDEGKHSKLDLGSQFVL